ncbi:MAG: PEP-CTERM sorting domain-containing protein [Acidobacteriota bacterium]|nr:PEP-CTERM sorting domain-containing protein [Acidobacteriota bacterium]
MRIHSFIGATAIVLGTCFGMSAATLTECPAATIAGSVYTGCNFAISANSDGSYSTGVDMTQPFFGGEDNYAGFINNTSHAISSLTINGQGVAIFEFDGDGPGLFKGATGYEGPDNTFSNISADTTTGTVNFTTPIAAGASTYFFLEETINFNKPPVGGTPEPATLGLMGASLFGLGCYMARRSKRA